MLESLKMRKGKVDETIWKGKVDEAIWKGKVDEAIWKGKVDEAIWKGKVNEAIWKGKVDEAIWKENASNYAYKIIIKKLEDTRVVIRNRRKVIQWPKGNDQAIILKTIRRKLKIEQHESH